MEARLWSIVLAANVGQPLSQGRDRGPEQFWRSSGTASLVRQTLARLAAMCPAERTVIVLNDGQREDLKELPRGPESVRLVFQPHDRGTAAGLLFGLLPVLTTDPAAVVLVTRSHPAVDITDAFHRGISDAVSCARRQFAVMQLLIPPTTARSSNEVVIVAQARALLHLCRQRLPVVSSVFVAALTMPTETRKRFLAAQYPHLPQRDLAQHVLKASGSLAGCTWPPSIGWSDVWTPEQRVQEPSPREPGRKALASASSIASATETLLAVE